MSTLINTMGSTQGEQKEVICTQCQLKFTDAVSLKLHFKTEFHLYNSKRRIAELEPISEEIFDAKKAQLQQQAIALTVTETLWKCMPCNKSFKSIEKLDEHKASKKHKRSEKEFKIANPDLQDDSSIFKSFSMDKSITGSSFMKDLNQSMSGNSVNSQLINEDNGEEAAKVKTTLQSLRICLFCNKESDGVKKNLDHMKNRHNFVILDVECLVNLKGLLSYIAERIQLGQMCLGCSKTFPNARRAQQHMIDKCHCVMNEEYEEEFEDYYDYALQYEGMGFEKKPEAIEADKVQAALWAEEAKNMPATVEEVDDWSDCDADDGENEPADQPKEEPEQKEEQVVVTEEKPVEQLAEVIGDNESSITEEKEDDIPSQSTNEIDWKNIKSGKKGKTRLEAFRQLDIEMPTILPTGEIKLPSGKIIGHRQYSHIYRQATKVPDTRECVIIGKLIAEKKQANMKLLALTAARDPSGVIASAKEQNKIRKDAHKYEQRYQRNKEKWGMQGNKIFMEHSRDQTGHLM